MAEGNANLPIVIKDWSLTDLADTMAPSTNKVYTINVGITGLTPVGICRINRWGANNQVASISEFYLNGQNQAVITFSNRSNITIDITALFITVMYM